MTLHESGEMYLETILRLSERLEIVRSIDIADEMGFSKPSVSRAMKTLSTNGYITINPSTGSVRLLESGRAIAEKIYERHKLLSEYLEKIGVDPQTAQEDACRIEHVISEESFEAIKNHVSAMIRQR